TNTRMATRGYGLTAATRTRFTKPTKPSRTRLAPACRCGPAATTSTIGTRTGATTWASIPARLPTATNPPRRANHGHPDAIRRGESLLRRHLRGDEGLRRRGRATSAFA